MGYTISEAAKRADLTAYTLRYYDKEGLLPFVGRNSAGNREFKDSDFEWLAVINCLKQSGMPVKQIKQFIDLCLEGDVSLENRLTIFEDHKKVVAKQMQELEKHMKKIDYKIWYYQTALAAGTEAVHSKDAGVLVED